MKEKMTDVINSSGNLAINLITNMAADIHEPFR